MLIIAKVLGLSSRFSLLEASITTITMTGAARSLREGFKILPAPMTIPHPVAEKVLSLATEIFDRRELLINAINGEFLAGATTCMCF
jgi:hypothetical protein